MNDKDYNAQGHDAPAGQQDPEGTGMSHGGSEFDAEQDFDAFTDDSSGKRSINSSALVLAAVVLFAVVGLFAMRTLTQASAVSTASTATEQSIESFLSVMAAGADGASGVARPLGKDEQAVLEVLNESYASRQVPLEYVQRNPFIIFEDVHQREEPRSTAEPKQEVDPIQVRRDETRALFNEAGKGIRLRSVLTGSNPLANLDNEIVREGDTFIAGREKVPFTVEKIGSDSVRLVAEDKELDLKVSVTVYIDRIR